MAEFKRLKIKEVILIKPRVFEDSRGYFFETYKASELKKIGISFNFVQDNQSKSKANTIRALHYQLEPKSQGKLVRVLNGSIFDVAVDIRKESPTYGKWVGEILTAKNKKMLWIPPGFAHGFEALENNTEVSYKTTNEYSPENESGVLWNDPQIGILWKNPEKAIISDKDKLLPALKNCKNNFIYKK